MHCYYHGDCHLLYGDCSFCWIADLPWLFLFICSGIHCSLLRLRILFGTDHVVVRWASILCSLQEHLLHSTLGILLLTLLSDPRWCCWCCICCCCWWFWLLWQMTIVVDSDDVLLLLLFHYSIVVVLWFMKYQSYCNHCCSNCWLRSCVYLFRGKVHYSDLVMLVTDLVVLMMLTEPLEALQRWLIVVVGRLSDDCSFVELRCCWSIHCWWNFLPRFIVVDTLPLLMLFSVNLTLLLVLQWFVLLLHFGDSLLLISLLFYCCWLVFDHYSILLILTFSCDQYSSVLSIVVIVDSIVVTRSCYDIVIIVIIVMWY